MAASLPSLIILCTTLWAPFPPREAVGQFEDVAKRSASTFLTRTESYYRPLFRLILWALWHNAAFVIEIEYLDALLDSSSRILPDLEERMEWRKKGRVLVLEKRST